MSEDRTEGTNGQINETCGTAVSPTANYCPNYGSALMPWADIPLSPPPPYQQASRGAILGKVFLIGCLMAPVLVLALLGLLLVLINLLD